MSLQYDWCAREWQAPAAEPLPFPELPDELFEACHDDEPEPDTESCDTAYAREVSIRRHGPL